MKLIQCGAAVVALWLACGCRSQQLDANNDLVDGGEAPAVYSFFGLPTGLQRVAIAKFVPSERWCSVVVLVFDQTSKASIAVPDGWAYDSAQVKGDVDACPTAQKFWPASASGTIEFPSGTKQFPCSASIDATLVSLASVDGMPRPANVPSTVRMRADDIPAQESCAP